NYNGFFLGLLGNGNATFQTTPQSLPNPDDVADVYVRDLDLDSRDDYIVTSWLGSGAMVALQTGGYKNCKPPSSANPAAKICSPVNGATVTSPVQIRAAGNSPEGIVQLQVWIDGVKRVVRWSDQLNKDRKSTRLNSSHVKISYAVFCLKKKNIIKAYTNHI